jgi:hypothetical protein
MGESSELAESSGGVFDVEHAGKLIFSKKTSLRFPADREIVEIATALKEGLSLAEACTRAEAVTGARRPPSITQWVKDIFQHRKI